LSWVHPGFSVYAGPPVEAAEIASLEAQARYITRPALALDVLEELENGNLVLETPPDPRTGATSIVLDPFEWIHRITSHILPDSLPIPSGFLSPLEIEMLIKSDRQKGSLNFLSLTCSRPSALWL
jgi:hypothetical protein